MTCKTVRQETYNELINANISVFDLEKFKR